MLLLFVLCLHISMCKRGQRMMFDASLDSALGIFSRATVFSKYPLFFFVQYQEQFEMRLNFVGR